MFAMIVPIVIFMACFGGGAVAAAQWLPGLDAGRVAGLAFFAVCGLLGAALGIAGLHIYSIAVELGRDFGLTNADVLAGGLRNILLDAGTLLGLAAIVYLLAPQHRPQPADLQAATSETE